MKHTGLLLIIWGLVLSCSSLPKIHQAKPSAAQVPNQICAGVYPVEDWQLLHTVEADLPGGRKGFLMGLTILSPQKRSVKCVMMTLEGLVVFDAVYDGRVKIKRAVPPFDNHAFAQGLMADIRLVFFKPIAAEITRGVLEDGSAVCRYRDTDDRIVDIANPGGNLWETKLYHSDHRLVRTVKSMLKDGPRPNDRPGIADKIELTAHGSPGYVLVLDLVEATRLGAE